MKTTVYAFLFALSYAADIPEVCYPSVVRHRIDSVFPTSRLFCVTKLNDELEYGGVEIVSDGEQWSLFSKSRMLEEEETSSDDNGDSLYFGNSSGIRLFKLPAAISDSDFCTGTQNVEIEKNLTVHCKPLSTYDMLSQCTENSFINALSLFGNGEFVDKSENKTLAIPRIAAEQMRAPVWNGSACNDVLVSANIVFRMNQTEVNDVVVQVEYGNLPGNVDTNWFQQDFSIFWIRMIQSNEDEKETNKSSSGAGYKAGDQIYRMQGSSPVPFAIPTLEECYSSSVKPSPVLFLRPMISVCTIRTTNCEDSRSKAKAFYEQVYPSELVSSISEDEHSAAVERVNVTWEDLSPSSSSCRLPVSSLLQIYHSKQGSTKNYREVVIAGNVQLLLDDVPYIPGQLIRLPVSISFTDVTPPPRHVFAALPYIDIRLPYDFFYPFINTSSSASSFHGFFLILLYTLLLIFFY
ncbi:hypothetical protein L5515_011842 [Caenorhabditis briggsae]|uniref:Tectonic-1-3 domain-containing protein n=1 Tax=Caenorhabditis briggsae TaxID=6238 RepID=A0AAE9JF04_CAEBR|nr:hypothetical protein L5515_011842 [Caenorhabditis briggsae]